MTGLYAPKTRESSAQPWPDGLKAARALRPVSPGLPDGIWRDEALETVLRALSGQLTPATREVLRCYARATRPRDWSDPGRGPVAYLAQKTVAETLGLTRRSVYRAECHLEKLGLIVKLSADNGRRYGPQGVGEEEVCGIYFAPLIGAYESFVVSIGIEL